MMGDGSTKIDFWMRGGLKSSEEAWKVSSLRSMAALSNSRCGFMRSEDFEKS
jgi:hypothetical protein